MPISAGGLDFEGIILVVGTGHFDASGADKTIYGGIFVSEMINEGTAENPDYAFGEATIRIDGRTVIRYDSFNIETSLNYLPLRQWSWREVRPELDQ
ncbi:MAG: hypothetical protein HY652_05770 [Acidobacteria bacterium]|nr:hypothetical protein [Acidobacteriota bacterium]